MGSACPHSQVMRQGGSGCENLSKALAILPGANYMLSLYRWADVPFADTLKKRRIFAPCQLVFAVL